MPSLKYDVIDLLEFFGVEPDVGEDEVWFTYTIVRNGLIFDFTIFPYDSVVIFSLKREGSSVYLFYAHITESEGLKLRRDRIPYLEVAPGKIFGGRFDLEYTIPYGFEIALEPDVQIKLFKK